MSQGDAEPITIIVAAQVRAGRCVTASRGKRRVLSRGPGSHGWLKLSTPKSRYGFSLTPRIAAKRRDDAKNNADLTRAGASEGTTRSGTGLVKVQSQMGLPPVATRAGSCAPRYFNARVAVRRSAQNRTILTPDAAAGIFTYLDSAGAVHKVNILTTTGLMFCHLSMFA